MHQWYSCLSQPSLVSNLASSMLEKQGDNLDSDSEILQVLFTVLILKKLLQDTADGNHATLKLAFCNIDMKILNHCGGMWMKFLSSANALD